MFDKLSPLLAWSVTVSGLLFVGGLFLVPILIARMRADYFVNSSPPPRSWSGLHPVLRKAIRGLKNGLGLLLVLAGIAMLVLPGQGLLSIFLGLTLMEFPGKRRLELGLVRRAPVLKAINWIRQRAGSPPLVLPDPDPDHHG